MSRKARRKAKKLPHHILSRGIKEVNLFNCNEDKELYLDLMRISSKIYGIEILSYCIMDTHVHIMVHPRGGDISKFMKNINNPYAKKYNIDNERRGHLFEGRFKNIVIENETQLLRTSTYIHCNAKDLLYQGYRSIKDYPYSSINDFIDPKRGRGIAKPGFIFSTMGGGWNEAMYGYMGLLKIQSQGKEDFQRAIDGEFEEDMIKAFKRGYYLQEKHKYVRDADPQKVVSILSKLLDVDNLILACNKYGHSNRTYKSILAICLRMFSNMTLEEMTVVFRGYTASTIGVLAKEGYKILQKEEVVLKQIEVMLASN